MEQSITFNNANGVKLFGIVHIPDKNQVSDKRIGVNLLNPGIKYRVAPNRLNVKIARKLCENGYFVLRFDPSGIGDSESELPIGELVPDIWEKIQKGYFVDDTITANRYFLSQFDINRLFLVGNCGGAITALLSSEKDNSIKGMCLIDIPVNLRTSKMSFADKVAPGGKKADWLFKEYIKRIFSPISWYRLVTAKTNYLALWKTMNMKFQFLYNSNNDTKDLIQEITKLCVDQILNKNFYIAYENALRKKMPILFILAGNDSGTEIFQRYFQNVYFKDELTNQLQEVFLIENANHVYTSFEWQKLLIKKICDWIPANY